MNVYESTDISLTGNGMGGLVPSECLITEEINGQFELAMIHPVDPHNKWLKIQLNNIIVVPTHRGDQCFRIYDIDTTAIDGSVVVAARHVFYDLLNNFIEEVSIDNQVGSTAGIQMLNACQYESLFSFFSNVILFKSTTLTRVNPVQALIGDTDGSFINVWGGELIRDNWDIDINVRMGADNGAKITYGKNLTGLRVTKNTKDIVTRIYPICQGAGNTLITLPEKYIDSDLIANYPMPIIGSIKYTDIGVGSDDYPTEEDVWTEMRARVAALYANGIDRPKLTFKVEMADLSKTEEYALFAQTPIALGDDVTVVYPPLEITQKMRVVSVVWDALNRRYKSLVIGDKSASLENHFVALEHTVEKLKEKTDNDWFDEKAKNIIPCYESIVAAPENGYNVVVAQNGTVSRGEGGGAKNIIVGYSPTASGDKNIAIGENSEATGTKATAIGSGASALSEGVAIGLDVTASDNSVVIGNGSISSDGGGNVVVGYTATAQGGNNIVMGTGDVTGGTNVSIGLSAAVNGGDNVAVGPLAAITGDYNSAIGPGAEIEGDNNIALGKTARINGLNSIAIGNDSTAGGDESVVIGHNAYSSGDGNIVIGDGSAEDNNRILIGLNQSGVVLIDGHSDDGITFNSIADDKTPLRVSVRSGQTANAFSVLDSTGAVVGGFEPNGGAVSITDRNSGSAVKLHISPIDSLPEELERDADTKYLTEMTDSELTQYRAIAETFETSVWGGM